ncbi:hypothetical protein TWF730_009130 [Orbilia blumenaviensis]|uniref:Uncharacterized protein n=1 Tax=Orbilia blumenaviensis TaxID=1796055 RepID=A0AAV9UZR0_9PEZI
MGDIVLDMSIKGVLDIVHWLLRLNQVAHNFSEGHNQEDNQTTFDIAESSSPCNFLTEDTYEWWTACGLYFNIQDCGFVEALLRPKEWSDIFFQRFYLIFQRDMSVRDLYHQLRRFFIDLRSAGEDYPPIGPSLEKIILLSKVRPALLNEISKVVDLRSLLQGNLESIVARLAECESEPPNNALVAGGDYNVATSLETLQSNKIELDTDHICQLDINVHNCCCVEMELDEDEYPESLWCTMRVVAEVDGIVLVVRDLMVETNKGKLLGIEWPD